MSKEPIQLVFHVPPFRGDPSRLMALLRRLEGLLLGTSFSWRTEASGPWEATDDTQWASNVRRAYEPERDRWIDHQFAAGEDVLVYSGPPYSGLSVAASPWLETPVRSGAMVETVVVHLAPGTVPDGVLTAILATAGDALEAWWCAFMPLAAAGLLLQVQRAPRDRPSPEQQRLVERFPALQKLPRLRGPTRELASVEVPASLGWINYWSNATARWLDFPDEARDAEWLARSNRTPTGGWILMLTDEWFDQERAEHLETLVRAYQRFDRIAPPHFSQEP